MKNYLFCCRLYDTHVWILYQDKKNQKNDSISYEAKAKWFHKEYEEQKTVYFPILNILANFLYQLSLQS